MIETLRASDNSIEATAEYFEIPDELMRAALRYYEDFRDEVDEWRARDAEDAELLTN